MNNNKRKNRLNTTRSSRVRGPERNVAAEGIYNNSQFMHAVTSHIGNTVQLQTQNGSVYEGIFRTFSSQFEIVLEMAHKVDPNDPERISVDNIIEKLIFKPNDIIEIEVVDVDLEFAAKGTTFQTDTAISKYNGQTGEKELEPWDESGFNGEDLELDGTTANGWDVNEMFRKNEQMYGVTSTFDTTMSGYTVQLTKRDTKEFKDAEIKAAKIANEIENNPTYKARIEVENDEEEKYAAVVRPNENTNPNENMVKPYVPPAKRKPQNVKVVKSNSVVASGSASIQQKPHVYPSAPSSALNNSTQVPFHHNSSHYHTTQTNGSQVSNTPSYPVAQKEQRVNGQVDIPPPKSQRVPARTGRNYNTCSEMQNNIAPRYQTQNGSLESIRASPNENSMSPPIHLNAPHPLTIPIQSSGTSPPHAVNYHNQQPLQEQSKPNTIDQHNNSSILQTNIERGRKIRGREEQLSELKKFGSDFKLSDANEEKKAHPLVTVSSIASASTTNTIPAAIEAEQRISEISKEQLNGEIEKANSALKKSTLNPNAKEFSPNVKTFIPRSPSTPTPSRPHTPQTPSYGPGPALPTMVLPTTYVVTTGQAAFSATPNQGSRFRKVPQHLTMSHRPDIASQMQVAAATGQPLLAPAPIHTQFTMPYSPQGHIPAQPYQQMVRMVAQQGGGMVPLVSSLNYHHDSPTQQPPQIQYMSPAPIAPLHPHHTHHHSHPPPNTAPSPGQSGQASQGVPGHSTTGAFHHTPQSPANSYPQPPPPPPQGPHPSNGPPTHTFPIMCPILPAPPPPPGSHNPHHVMAAAQGTIPPYAHHHHQHQVGSQPHIQVILPHGQ